MKIFGSRPLSTEAKLWCPGLDKEMKQNALDFIGNFNGVHKIALEGGLKQLKDFCPTGKLYIMAHGHTRLPKFITEKGSWDAGEIASMLEKDGLSKKQKDIELLVCHAGQSVNLKEGEAVLGPIFKDAKQVKNKFGKDSTQFKGLANTFDGLQKTFPKPQEFTDPEKMLLPLAALLSQELKKRKYTNFRVCAYKCQVSTDEFKKGMITLDPSDPGRKDKTRIRPADQGYNAMKVFWV